MFVSVIIPTYQDWERLDKCLHALRNQSYPKDSFEIIVVNNDVASTPPNPMPGVKYISEWQPGSYAARNSGIKIAQGDVIAFTDSDCIPAADWIASAVAIMEVENIDRITGPVDIFSEGKSKKLVEAYDRAFAFNQLENVKNGYCVTANLIVRKRLFEVVGLFDATRMSGGDVAWNKLASSMGLSISYDSNVRVLHPARNTLKQLLKKAIRVNSSYIDRYGFTWKFVFLNLAPPFHLLFRVVKGRNLNPLDYISFFSVSYILRLCSLVVLCSQRK
ncbi:glycosyltransferase [Salinibius halmophilus]|uniref:glycosyltransferase n=1 Tax=Salinibius halmophilus TaxID=1853216 RepID=UPI000E661335|nr:glycosyltransferase [Salinibius halmophilus]